MTLQGKTTLVTGTHREKGKALHYKWPRLERTSLQRI